MTDLRDGISLRDWQPVSRMVSTETAVLRPAHPAIDVHNHLGRWLSQTGEWLIPDVRQLIRLMDDTGVETIVNLDGRWGDELSANRARYDLRYPDRFLTFCQLDWDLMSGPDGEGALHRQLEDGIRRGARGVKVWKNLGLHVRDADGTLVMPDDPRVIAVLAHAGELGLPVLIHIADPLAFFDPLDARNERLEELLAHPDWWVGDRRRFPSFDRLMTSLEVLVMSTPATRYIGAHVGCAAEDLDRVEALLDRAPNFVVDIGARMAELGRQPRRTRELIDRHPDRVLFGTDAFPITAAAYRHHFRFLETADESFAYAPEDAVPPQGRWTVSGLHLDDDQLRAIYRDNARRVLELD